MSDSSRKSVERESSGPVSEKKGFSVVAPMRTSEAVLDVREQRVLLGAAEAVDLVEEEDGAPALLAQAGPGPVGDLAHVLHARGDRRQRFERLAGGAGHEAGDGRLAGAGRTPEHDRRQPVGLDQHPQRPAGPEQVLLAEHLVERARPQAGRERRPPLEALGDRSAEEVVGHRPMLRPTVVERRVRARLPFLTDREGSPMKVMTRGVVLVAAVAALGGCGGGGSDSEDSLSASSDTTTTISTLVTTAPITRAPSGGNGDPAGRVAGPVATTPLPPPRRRVGRPRPRPRRRSRPPTPTATG